MAERETGNDKAQGARDKKAKVERKLDEALAETYPASDPPAVGCPTSDEKPARPVDREPPPIDTDLVKELAEGVRKGKT